MHWYDDLPHIGYDVNGKKVLRPARGDELDKFLQTVDDPSSWLCRLRSQRHSEADIYIGLRHSTSLCKWNSH